MILGTWWQIRWQELGGAEKGGLRGSAADLGFCATLVSAG